MTHHPARLLAALGFAAALAPAAASAQERLYQPLFADESLHRLGLHVFEEPTEYEVDMVAGVDAAMAKGAMRDPARPFGAFAGVGFGFRRPSGDLVQLRSQMTVPLPVGLSGSTGPLSVWDLDGAHRLRARLGLGGIEGEHLAKGEAGVDLELEGAAWMRGRYGTSFFRRDIGPFAFRDLSGRATLWPRLAPDNDIALVMPVAAELRRVEVDRPEGVAAFTSQRLWSGFGVRPHLDKVSHGWFEVVGAGYERIAFSPAVGGPRPAFTSLEHLDVRALHAEGMIFSPEKEIAVEISTNVGGDWIWDKQSGRKVAAPSASIAGVIRGYPDHDKPGEDDELAVGFGASSHAGYLADATALAKLVCFETFFEAAFLAHRTGGSLHLTAEQLDLVASPQDIHHGFRGAVTSEWYLSPVQPLEVGVEHASTQQCVSPETRVGAAWCHRLGLFVRVADRWLKERERQPEKPPAHVAE
jgi:hypothetical protein